MYLIGLHGVDHNLIVICRTNVLVGYCVNNPFNALSFRTPCRTCCCSLTNALRALDIVCVQGANHLFFINYTRNTGGDEPEFFPITEVLRAKYKFKFIPSGDLRNRTLKVKLCFPVLHFDNYIESLLLLCFFCFIKPCLSG